MRLGRATIDVCLAVAVLGVLANRAEAQNDLYVFYGPPADDWLGFSVGSAGDVNQDGFADVIAGAPQLTTWFAGIAGYARVYSGKDGSALHVFQGAGNDVLGAGADGAGDVNGDGYADLVVGAPQPGMASNQGYVRVQSGKDGSILYTFLGDPLSRLGYSVSGAGDVNNDGYPDVVAGAPMAVFVLDGMVRVFSGKDGTVLYSFPGDAMQQGELGYSVSGAGDLNSDGFADVIGGAPFGNYPAPGLARAYSGKTGATLYTFGGSSTGEYQGYSVSAAGDTNNDGFDDVVVGAYGAYHMGADAGRITVYSGMNGAPLHQFFGGAAQVNLGFAVSEAGDFDGDGYDDVMGGAPRENGIGTDSGSVLVYSGKDGSILHSYGGPVPFAQIGRALGGAADVNGDGFVDVIVGAPLRKNTGFTAGSVHVFSGVCGPVATYGSGCSGSGGVTAQLAVTGCPTPGGTVSLELTGGLGGALVFLLVGTQQSAIPMAGRCSLSVFPPIGPLGPFFLSGTGPGNGALVVPTGLPITAPLATVTTQAFVVDPAGVAGYSNTNGVALAIQ